ncbi:uncharacterized protein LOC113343256 [Papaver somniferum]|uniref:uncharacterized protein LOC113343256 n=1 Tax=Papaver somniferum TaxID=3469 RepID=UPI000E6F4B36|nr:uncharacterized protein LOC113343256 [Papaver somniferum]
MNINVSVLQKQRIKVDDWISTWFQSTVDSNSKSDKQAVLKCMLTAWFIWKNRCSKLFENIDQNILSTSHSINFMLKQCQITTPQRRNNKQVWQLPLQNEVKINMDVAFDYNTKTIGLGLLIRDYTGFFQGIRCKFINGGVDSEQAECLVLKEAILFARQRNLRNVVLESDNLNVVNAVKNANSSVHWRNQVHVDEIRHLIISFPCFKLNYVNRTANNVAHVIAKTARSNRLCLDYYVNFPENINLAIWKDKQARQSKLCSITS